MKTNYIIGLVSAALLLGSCSKKDDNVPEIIEASERPQIILPDDEGDGNIEDDDEVGIVLALLDRIDVSGEELGGAIQPLDRDVTVTFEVKDPKGFTTLDQYILEWEAFYEIDDCTTSEDAGIDLKLQFNPVTGEGSVTFPADVEEIEIAFTLDESLFDDDVFNTEERGFTFQLTGISDASGQDVVANTAISFEYEVLDDKGIFGEWSLDVADTALFNSFVALFGPVNDEIAKLAQDDVDEIILEFKYDELSVLAVLKETEMVEECGESEEENLEIEIEMDYDDLDADALSGGLSFEGELEFDDKPIEEYSYEGAFEINASTLTLTLSGEYDDDIDEQVLILTK